MSETDLLCPIKGMPARESIIQFRKKNAEGVAVVP